MKRTLAFAAAGLAALAAPLAAQTLVERVERDQVATMRAEEPAMRNAMLRAQATLDEFLAKAKAPPPGTAGYAVKVGVREGENVEYLWVDQVLAIGAFFSGTVNNVPRVVKSVRAGQVYTFSRAQIVDWTYVDQIRHKTVGNFTACALLTKEPALEAEEFKRGSGLDCN